MKGHDRDLVTETLRGWSNGDFANNEGLLLWEDAMGKRAGTVVTETVRLRTLMMREYYRGLGTGTGLLTAFNMALVPAPTFLCDSGSAIDRSLGSAEHSWTCGSKRHTYSAVGVSFPNPHCTVLHSLNFKTLTRKFNIR